MLGNSVRHRKACALLPLLFTAHRMSQNHMERSEDSHGPIAHSLKSYSNLDSTALAQEQTTARRVQKETELTVSYFWIKVSKAIYRGGIIFQHTDPGHLNVTMHNNGAGPPSRRTKKNLRVDHGLKYDSQNHTTLRSRKGKFLKCKIRQWFLEKPKTQPTKEKINHIS